MEQLPSAADREARSAGVPRTPDRATDPRERTPQPTTAPPTPQNQQSTADQVRNRTSTKPPPKHPWTLYGMCNLVAVSTFNLFCGRLVATQTNNNTRSTEEFSTTIQTYTCTKIADQPHPLLYSDSHCCSSWLTDRAPQAHALMPPPPPVLQAAANQAAALQHGQQFPVEPPYPPGLAAQALNPLAAAIAAAAQPAAQAAAHAGGSGAGGPRPRERARSSRPRCPACPGGSGGCC